MHSADNVNFMTYMKKQPIFAYGYLEDAVFPFLPRSDTRNLSQSNF